MRVLAALGMVALLACWAAAADVPVVQQPTWDVGDSWTYSDPAAGQLKYTVRESTPDHYLLEYQTPSATSTVTFERDLSQRGPKYLGFQWPLSQGSKWEQKVSGTVAGGAPSTWNITWSAETYESVTVPGGTFDAFRIKARHCNLTYQGSYSNCGDYTIWYAPKAKFFVKMSWGPSSYWIPQTISGKSRELLSYQLHSP